MFVFRGFLISRNHVMPGGECDRESKLASSDSKVDELYSFKWKQIVLNLWFVECCASFHVHRNKRAISDNFATHINEAGKFKSKAIKYFDCREKKKRRWKWKQVKWSL